MKMHYLKLAFRSLVFISALILYIYNRNHPAIFLTLIWCVFAIEMILRFLPSQLESMGCQKQFRKNFHPTNIPKENTQIQAPIRTWIVIAAWFSLNGFIALLYYTHIIDEGVLLLISLAYSICDIICILFFCPFQTWFMKNRCCCTCRIYNWDFAMMFTPLIFVKTIFAQTLVILSLALLIRWEYTLYRHPEYFSENTNSSLSCNECQEKLCHHKKQLHRFWKREKKLS